MGHKKDPDNVFPSQWFCIDNVTTGPGWHETERVLFEGKTPEAVAKQVFARYPEWSHVDVYKYLPEKARQASARAHVVKGMCEHLEEVLFAKGGIVCDAEVSGADNNTDKDQEHWYGATTLYAHLHADDVNIYWDYLEEALDEDIQKGFLEKIAGEFIDFLQSHDISLPENLTHGDASEDLEYVCCERHLFESVTVYSSKKIRTV